MCMAIDKEQVVAGYVNLHEDGTSVTIDALNKYIRSFWNAGCGPIRLNFTQQELRSFLDCCEGICLSDTLHGYIIDKSGLGHNLSQEEQVFLGNDEELYKSYDLFRKLHVDLRTPDYLLDAMGFQFVYA